MTEEESAALSLDFGKKKKKKTTKAAVVEEKPVVETKESKESKEEEDDGEEIDTKHLEEANVNDDTTFGDDDEETSTSKESKPLVPMKFASDSSYTYDELVERIFGLINAAKPEEKIIFKMKPPQVYKVGTTRTAWGNFPAICKTMNRDPIHVQQFTLAEVGSTGSIDGTGGLVIRGRFLPKHIENILRRYIQEYVKCGTCKSPETTLKKESRLTFMVCSKCNSTRSVAAIKTGYTATTRAGRRAAAATKT
eukprot:TRINITY_DN1440_c0_g1_i1.p1 TRINITY_DN1440_c0_g1~~TRINITY_DN1440_c0_g1_i1.p1  ORF type:complete len:251 (-),score=89.37 TRINITY_DN1440_c0_g1_i1:101-853(-)